ncbi:hypothetical protein D9613_004496 [Agrocybe pediades]|uniref:MYND-type domain-containing protein n=1 Tax=Agrocybe pediades TaxID=84607 RepID=A0A8H4VJ01_9AGAR|nr:hypothetical protein D9613_004496 [Agrocybe pediades]
MSSTKYNCFNCYKLISRNAQRCTGCEFATYCNADCQRKHWSSHKADCRQGPSVDTRPSGQLALAWYRQYRFLIQRLALVQLGHNDLATGTLEENKAAMREHTENLYVRLDLRMVPVPDGLDSPLHCRVRCVGVCADAMCNLPSAQQKRMKKTASRLEAPMVMFYNLGITSLQSTGSSGKPDTLECWLSDPVDVDSIDGFGTALPSFDIVATALMKAQETTIEKAFASTPGPSTSSA